jgi:DNA-binding IscR family transcriptional regulator
MTIYFLITLREQKTPCQRMMAFQRFLAASLTSVLVVTMMVTTAVMALKQISTRFSIAVHVLALISVSSSDCTSDFIAGSVNTNPVIVRRILGMLKKAGLVEVRPGVGGATLLKPPEEISLLDVYRAVEATEAGGLFRFHDEPNLQCPVGRNIESALRSEMTEAQLAMEHRLAQVSLSQLTAKFR